MGHTLQEILQGRGDKKRQGFRVKTVFPFLFLFLTYLGLLLEFPVKRQVLWFIFGFLTFIIYSFLHLAKHGRERSVEFLLSIALLLAGSAQAFSMPWLKMAYFPFLVLLAVFYEQKTVLSVLLFIPFLELADLLRGAPPAGEAAFLVSLAASTGLSLFLRRRTENKILHSVPIREGEAFGSPYPGAETEAVSDGKAISDYFDLVFNPDDELSDILQTAKNAVFADAVSLFTAAGSDLRLRYSTEEPGEVITSGGGMLQACFAERQHVISSDMKGTNQEAGYLKKETISSLVGAPVMDGSFPLGVLVADSARVHAFTATDCDTIQMFARQALKVLQRERIFPQIERSYSTMQILNEESAKLLSSLDESVIVRNLLEGAYRIAPSEILFFIVKGREVEILQEKAATRRENRVFNSKGTVLDMASKNREPVYISDVRDYRSPVMPFKTDGVNAVFLLPLFYERSLLGMLALLFEKTNALSSYQIELLGVLGNQASTSIANARFHAAIERLAVTDGLTGLFNHKQFQERLSVEFQRLERFSDPLSLLLIDIDHFKKINDTYGHPVGDSVLKKVAGVIKKTIRNIDIPARYGGEEFAVVLAGTDEKGAMNMSERLRRTVMETKFVSGDDTFSVTVSVGVSTSADSVQRKEDLIERADKALYHAKGSGRNRSIHWNGL